MKRNFLLLAAATLFIASCKDAPKADEAKVGVVMEASALSGTTYHADLQQSDLIWIGTTPVVQHRGKMKLENGVLSVENGGISGGRFDIVILKDVIEHIHDQSRLLARLKDFLTPGGIIFFGFPPWQMPFGGHQQLCKNSLSKVPYFHLLPKPLYKGILKLFKEPDHVVTDLLEIKDTGISIERFKKIVRENNYQVIGKIDYFINPIYEYKFNLKPRKQNTLISKIPYVRNFVTTCVYYIIKGNP